MNDIKEKWITDNLVAKCSCKEEQIKAKSEIIKKIEIQLLGNEDLTPQGIQDIVSLMNKYGTEIVSVHPKIKNKRGITIKDVMNNSKIKSYIRSVCELANEFGKGKNKLINVVIHNDYGYEIQHNDIFIFNFYETIKYLAYDLENIRIVFENVTPIKKNENNEIYLCNGLTSFSNSLLCEAVRSSGKIHTGLVLDTCHTMMTKQFFDLIKPITDYDFTMEQEIINAKYELEIIHLCNMKGIGTGKDHGCPFKNTEEDKKKLLEIFNTLKLCHKRPYLVLEIQDDDYTHPENLKETINTIYQVIEENHLE